MVSPIPKFSDVFVVNLRKSRSALRAFKKGYYDASC